MLTRSGRWAKHGATNLSARGAPAHRVQRGKGPTMTQAPPAAPAPGAEQKASGLAIASLVCGLIICCWPLTGIAAVICGHLAMAKINRGEAGGKTLATVGLVLGYIGIALGILSIILQLAGVVENPWMRMQQ